MKRSGDDLPSGSQSKKAQFRRPSRREADTLAFMKLVHETFKDDKEKLDRFNDLCVHRVNRALFVARLQELIKGHNNLIDKFNTMFPGIEKDLKGFVFCEKLEKRLGIDEFQKFTDMLYSMGSTDTIARQQTRAEMNSLLVEHQDLMVEFNELLEMNYEHLCVSFIAVAEDKELPAPVSMKQ